jgi:hypothetical protein
MTAQAASMTVSPAFLASQAKYVRITDPKRFSRR